MNDDEWTKVLFDWADLNELPELEWFQEDEDFPEYGFWHGFPRCKKDLMSMTELNLGWHDLTDLPDELGNLKKLCKLSFNKCPDGWQVRPKPKTDNRLPCIPQWVYYLPNLTSLDFSGNAITKVSNEIGRLSELEALWLDANEINVIPDSIGQCLKLNELGLRNNRIDIIPESLFECKKLESLLLEANKIESIPKGLSQLKNLSVLELARNKFASYPEDINLLENLTYLTLLGNKFTDLPTGPLHLKHIEVFDMLNFKYSEARCFGRSVLH